MRAMILEAPESIAERDIRPPTADEGETLVRVSGAGICATDLKIYQGGIPVHYPRIMGHEMIGEIVEGRSGDGAGPGEMVLIDPVLTCGSCHLCRHGQANLCQVGALLGRDRDGGFAELVAAPTANVYGLPDGVDLAAAPMMQVLTTCLHGQERADIQPGDVVAVTGLGVSGQMHVQLARAAGAGTVIGVSRNAAKRELAAKIGADVVADHGEDAREVVLAASDGRGADVVIESVGNVRVLGEAIDLARIGGRLVPFGIYTETQGELPFYQLYFKELAVINARAAMARDFPASIDLVASGKVDITSLLSHRLPLEHLDQAIGLLGQSSSDRMKVVLTYD